MRPTVSGSHFRNSFMDPRNNNCCSINGDASDANPRVEGGVRCGRDGGYKLPRSSEASSDMSFIPILDGQFFQYILVGNTKP